MKNKYLVLVLLAFLAICIFVFNRNYSAVTAVENTSEINSSLANPASVFCIENGGKSSVVEGQNGESENCTFDNGQTCDSWALYRGECNVVGVSESRIYKSASTSVLAIFRIKDGKVIVDAPSLNLNYSELKSDISASGARYTNADGKIEFWEHQGEASISIDGKNVFTGK